MAVNTDGLHQAAGSKEVLELHGSVHRNYCEKCGKIEYFGLYSYKGFSTDDWDGSDMFFLKNWPGVLLVTTKVKKVITKNKFKNIRFEPLKEFQFT